MTESNIHAFLRATSRVSPNDIPGFLRIEVNDAGAVSLPEVHGFFHWKPESVRQRGGYTVAEFTNEHAAFYILTQDQLRRAIASGGFLRPPYEGRYAMRETAATDVDVYTSCGLRKVLCISALDDFLIHHLSNRYAGQLGVPMAEFKKQIESTIGHRSSCSSGEHPL